MVIASVPGLNVVEPVTAIAYGMAHKSCVVGGNRYCFYLDGYVRSAVWGDFRHRPDGVDGECL